jgi:methylenetetrahydrofolate dehydrogenase (NADP+)/methenyltetrahydrofolate cyclohydrolase
MGTKLEGKPVVQDLRGKLKERVENLEKRGVIPTILILRVGEREDDISYERGILKSCEALGIKSRVEVLPGDISTDELVHNIKAANKYQGVHGIMLFRPLPAHLDQALISKAIDPKKDIDCMSPVNLEKVFEGTVSGFVPCTPKAVVEMLKGHNIPLNGANIAVVGRSMVVGKPLAMLLLNENATVTICHSKTKDMPSVTKSADIVVAAIGKAKFMDGGYFHPDSVVIDVGINDSGDGKICGDVDFEQVFYKVKAITPAIGGVGSITTTILLTHVVQACEMLLESE